MYDIIRGLFGLSNPKGFSESEIDEVKKLHGKIPVALERYYKELGREEAVNHTQNRLIVPWKYTWPQSKSHLIVYAENQYVCVWGISLSDLDMENPPVYVTFDNNDEAIWELEAKPCFCFLCRQKN